MSAINTKKSFFYHSCDYVYISVPGFTLSKYIVSKLQLEDHSVSLHIIWWCAMLIFIYSFYVKGWETLVQLINIHVLRLVLFCNWEWGILRVIYQHLL